MKSTLAHKIAIIGATLGASMGLTARPEPEARKPPSPLAKQRRSRGYREKRKCLATGCTKMHNHNNAYCSAECCKAHRAEQKRRGSKGEGL